MIIGHGRVDHNGTSYKIKSYHTGCAITSMERHIKPTTISAEDYLQNEVTKANQTLESDRPNELVNHFTGDQWRWSIQQNRNRRGKQAQTKTMPETHYI